MRRLQLVIVTALLLAIPGVAMAADEVSVSDLISESEEMSGVEIIVAGELVGDYGFRGDGWMWTQLNGDIYVGSPIREGGDPVGGNTGVGIRMPSRLGEGLGAPGGYRSRGPNVRVAGIWKHHDPARQGESYLEVTSMTILEPGRPMGEGPQWIATWTGLALVAGALVLRLRDRPVA